MKLEVYLSQRQQKAFDRAMKAHELRMTGLTFKKIGEHFGVSLQRARQMFYEAERLIAAGTPRPE